MSVICPRSSVKKKSTNDANDNKIRLKIPRYGIQLTIQRYVTEVEIRSQGSRWWTRCGLTHAGSRSQTGELIPVSVPSVSVTHGISKR